MTRVGEWRFESDDPCEARMRRHGFLAYLGERGGPGTDLDAAALIYGELVGNVILHARGPIRIVADWLNGFAVLRVSDSGNGFACDTCVSPDASAEHGRGLFIIRQLARNVTVACSGGGCEVAVVLNVRLAA